MAKDSREKIIAFLQQDVIKNMNMLYFMENNPVHHLERIGDSVILRGQSDQRWVYISSPNEQELQGQRSAKARLWLSKSSFDTPALWRQFN